jgi:hypothetical protein
VQRLDEMLGWSFPSTTVVKCRTLRNLSSHAGRFTRVATEAAAISEEQLISICPPASADAEPPVQRLVDPDLQHVEDPTERVMSEELARFSHTDRIDGQASWQDAPGIGDEVKRLRDRLRARLTPEEFEHAAKSVTEDSFRRTVEERWRMHIGKWVKLGALHADHRAAPARCPSIQVRRAQVIAEPTLFDSGVKPIACPNALSAKDFPTRASVTSLLCALKGELQIGELAAAIGGNRATVSRWLKGAGEPRLPDFLRVVQASTQRLLEFVEIFAPPDALSFDEAVVE